MSAILKLLLRGPNLDQLSPWGKLEELPFSLDSPLWQDAGLYSLAPAESARSQAALPARILLKGQRALSAASSTERCLGGFCLRQACRCGAVSRGGMSGILIPDDLPSGGVSSARCFALTGAARAARLRAGARSVCRGLFGAQRSARAAGGAATVCHARLLITRSARLRARSITICRGELRGHGWVQTPASASLWIERIL